MAIDVSAMALQFVRGEIARAVLDGAEVVPRILGDVTLRPHQHAAAVRLLALISSRGGAMLAEPVGVGKTYTALAVAARTGGETLIVAPAALRDMWSESL